MKKLLVVFSLLLLFSCANPFDDIHFRVIEMEDLIFVVQKEVIIGGIPTWVNYGWYETEEEACSAMALLETIREERIKSRTVRRVVDCK